MNLFKILVYLFASLVLTFSLSGISGVIESNTTWTKADSPYVVEDNILIAEGTSLTIEAGVVVKFAPSTYLKVEGHLKGIGSEVEQVIFESSSIGSSWAGVKIRSTGGTNLDQSQNYQSGSILKNVTIRDASLGLYIHSTGFLVEQCKFYNNQTAMEVRSTTGVVVRDSNFTDNSGGITSVYSDYSGDNVSRINNTQIVGNTFNGNDTGIGLIMNQRDFKDLNISKNIFRDGGTAIRFGGGGYGPRVHSVYINDNVVLNHSTGIDVANVYGAANEDTSTMPEYPIDCQRNILVGNTISLSVSANSMKNRFSHNIFIGPNGISISSSGGNDLYAQNVVITDSKGVSLSGSSSYHPNSISVDRNLLIQKEQSSSPFVDFLWGSNHKLTNNNILGLGEVLKIGTANDANVTGNYWGKTTLESIRELTNDYYDDFEKGKALVEPFETSWRTDVPIMPPGNVEKIGVEGGVKISWEANAESDVTGYRIHYGAPSGYDYANVVNVGTDLNYTISGLSALDEISVTAYDAGASGLDDANSTNHNQLNLSESWFSKAVIKGYYIAPTAGNGGTVTGSGVYEIGSTANFTADPQLGYVFQKWVIDQDKEFESSSIAVVVDRPIKIDAFFGKDLDDDDNDSLSNYDELVVYKTNPQNPDSDSDLIQDNDELSIGTNPIISDEKIVSYFEAIAKGREQNAKSIGFAEGNATGYEAGFVEGNKSGVNLVIKDPRTYELYNENAVIDIRVKSFENGFTEGNATGYEAGFVEGNKSGVDLVIKNPNNYNLFEEDYISFLIEKYKKIHELKGKKEGENAVLDNPALYGLRRLEDKEKVSPYTLNWFYEEELGWVYTNHLIFPYMFKSDHKDSPSAWLFFEQGADHPRFYNYNTEVWFELKE